MHTAAQVAKHIRDVHVGGNWTSVNLKDSLQDINWQQATTQLYQLNTIAALVFHINYYVAVVIKVLEGGPLDAHDKYSYDLPPIGTEQAWEQLKEKALADAERFATLVEQLPDEILAADFANAKYGTYYRNLQGIIEHTHYHLGQIVIIKKMLVASGQQ